MTLRGKHITVHIRKYLFKKILKNYLFEKWFLLLLLILHTLCGTNTGWMWKNSYCLLDIDANIHWVRLAILASRIFIEHFSHFFIWLTFFFGGCSSLFCLIITWTWTLFHCLKFNYCKLKCEELGRKIRSF